VKRSGGVLLDLWETCEIGGRVGSVVIVVLNVTQGRKRKLGME
jgi:hypothetical protein